MRKIFLPVIIIFVSLPVLSAETEKTPAQKTEIVSGQTPADLDSSSRKDMPVAEQAKSANEKKNTANPQEKHRKDKNEEDKIPPGMYEKSFKKAGDKTEWLNKHPNRAKWFFNHKKAGEWLGKNPGIARWIEKTPSAAAMAYKNPRLAKYMAKHPKFRKKVARTKNKWKEMTPEKRRKLRKKAGRNDKWVKKAIKFRRKARKQSRMSHLKAAEKLEKAADKMRAKERRKKRFRPHDPENRRAHRRNPGEKGKIK